MKEIKVENTTLYEVNSKQLQDKEAVYVVFPGNSMPPQWGVTDVDREVTIHKDLTVRFTDRCRYYVLTEHDTEGSPIRDNIIRLRA